MKDLNRNKVQGVKPRANGPRSLLPSARVVILKASGRIMLVLMAAGIIGAGGGYGARQCHNYLTTSPLFAVKSIEVSGVQKLAREDILRLARVVEGENIFKINARDAVRRIASNPWIKGVTVRRQFPDRVIIRVVERQVESLVRRSGLWYIEADGSIFKQVVEGDPVDMPIVCGPGNTDAPDDPDAIGRGIEIMRFAAASGQLPISQISEVILSPAGMITIVIAGPLSRVDFGAGDLKSQWDVLEKVLADVRHNGMEAVRVDLNYPSGAAVRLSATGSRTLLADGRPAGLGQQ